METAAMKFITVITRNGMAIPAPSGIPARVMFTTIAETASPRAMAFSTKTDVRR